MPGPPFQINTGGRRHDGEHDGSDGYAVQPGMPEDGDGGYQRAQHPRHEGRLAGAALPDTNRRPAHEVREKHTEKADYDTQRTVRHPLKYC